MNTGDALAQRRSVRDVNAVADRDRIRVLLHAVARRVRKKATASALGGVRDHRRTQVGASQHATTTQWRETRSTRRAVGAWTRHSCRPGYLGPASHTLCVM